LAPSGLANGFLVDANKKGWCGPFTIIGVKEVQDMPPAQAQVLQHHGDAEPGNRAAARRHTEIDDDAVSNASSDYHEPLGAKEQMEHRYAQMLKWISRNRVLFDFVAYAFFLLVFTVVVMEANPGEDLIEQVGAADVLLLLMLLLLRVCAFIKCVCACMYVCVRVCSCVCMCACGTKNHTHTCIHMFVCKHKSESAHVRVCILYECVAVDRHLMVS